VQCTPIQTDNSTASGIANDTINQQRSRSIDMLFYWIRDRVKQGHFIVFVHLERQTSLITSANTIHQNIIKASDKSTYINKSQPIQT
jgi:hypothetical protein